MHPSSKVDVQMLQAAEGPNMCSQLEGADEANAREPQCGDVGVVEC